MATNRTVTVKSSGGDYASLNAAFAGEVGNLVSLDRQLTIECYNFEDTTAVDTSGQSWTTDATRYVLVKAVDDHGGKWSTSAYRLVTGAATCINNTTIAFLHVQGLQLHQSGGGSYYFVRIGAGGTGWHKIEKCIGVCDATSGNTAYAIGCIDSSQTAYVWNSVFYATSNTSARGVYQYSDIPAYVYNCTFDGWGYAVYLRSTLTSETNLVLKNVRATSMAAGVVYAPGGGTLNTASNYNLTDSAAPTNWGSNSIDSTDTPTIDYVDDSNATLTSRDYHLGATDSGIGAGTDLSADGSLAFSDDIDGDTRS